MGTAMEVPEEYQPTLNFFWLLNKLKIVSKCWTPNELAMKALDIQMKYWRGTGPHGKKD